MSTRPQALWLCSFVCLSATLLQAQHTGEHSGSSAGYASGVGKPAIAPYHAPASIGLSAPSIALSPPSIGLSVPTISPRFGVQYPAIQGSPKTNGSGYVNGPWRQGSHNGRYAYGLPFTFFGAPYNSSYASDSGEQPNGDSSNVSDTNSLSDQVQQLSAKIDQLQNQLSRQSGDASASASPEQTTPAPPITVILNDGRMLEVQSYAIVGNVFWDFSNEPASKIPLSRINLAASVKASEMNGVEFPQVGANH